MNLPYERNPLRIPLVSRVTAALLVLFAVVFSTVAQEPKKDPPKEPPKVALANSLAAAPGATTRITLRGWKLDAATEVKSSSGQAEVKLVKKEKAPVPNKQDAKRIGDTQVEIELTLSPDFPVGTLNLVVLTPDGESAPHEILVGGPHPIVAEKEPNDGFRQAQELSLPQIVDGAIHAAHNVDVYAFDGVAGRKIVCELIAARRGSGLDGQLTLYDSKGNVLLFADDFGESRDPRLEFSPSAAGRYYLVLQDAHDQGGPAHPYRLVISTQ